MTGIAPEFSHIVDARLVPAAGLTLDLNANEQERAALARRFGIAAINALSAHVELIRVNKKRVRASADIKGEVVQNCVVTLEPFAQTVATAFAVTVCEDENAVEDSLKINEIDVDAVNDEDVEYSPDGKIDIGELVAEYFSLALDPFPHAPNAVFQGKTDVEKSKNAFGVLEKLNFK